MKENVLKMTYPEELLLSLKKSKEEFEEEAKLLFALITGVVICCH